MKTLINECNTNKQFIEQGWVSFLFQRDCNVNMQSEVVVKQTGQDLEVAVSTTTNKIVCSSNTKVFSLCKIIASVVLK